VSSGSATAVIARLDQELRAIWKAPEGEGSTPLTRVCTMNLEVVAPTRELLERYTGVVDEVTATIPARAILASIEPDAETALDGDVSAVCFPHGSTKVCSERIVLRASGRMARAAASAIEAFLVPELPTALVWLGRVHVDDPVFQDLANDAQRIILDSEYTSIASVIHVARWARSQPDAPKIVDLAWTRVSMWQEMLARFFDAAERRPLADAVTKLTLEQASAPGSRVGPEAALVLGWIATRLGWKPSRLGGALRFLRRDGGTVHVELGAVPCPAGVAPHALAALSVEARATDAGPAAAEGRPSFLRGTIRRELGSGLAEQEESTPDADVVAWRLESDDTAIEQRIRLGANKAAKWLERTLHRPASDPAFDESVAFAEQIVEDGLGCA
jgi:glucose-6-phosphate dehydrogenase assembly protein OpcA